MKIETTTVNQLANEMLGTKNKELYYLIISNEKGGKLVVNVGEKTHNEVKRLQNEELNKEPEPVRKGK